VTEVMRRLRGTRPRLVACEGTHVPGSAGAVERMCTGSADPARNAAGLACIGFAMLEAVVVLASVLQRFRLAPVPGAAFPAAEPRITLRPAAVELIVDPR